MKRQVRAFRIQGKVIVFSNSGLVTKGGNGRNEKFVCVCWCEWNVKTTKRFICVNERLALSALADDRERYTECGRWN